ncbi:hypothetical protein [Streptomyces sp. NPDC097619]|uniref:hypothetical protein n=1 Tax=Streptomyces sp. NPDC097619 TaxID=3157228 RepID=UPI003318717D
MRPTLPERVTIDPFSLAAHLSHHDMPGQRSGTDIRRLRDSRACRNTVTPVPQLDERLAEWLRDRAVDEVIARGGEIEIQGRSGRPVTLEISDRAGGMVVLHAEGWRSYGRSSPARWVALSYLWGSDDAGSGPWAVRLPGTVTTVAEGLEALTPATVKHALEMGRRVRRQGDVYLVETSSRYDGAGLFDLPSSHEWRPGTRYLVHRPEDGRRHRPVRALWPVRFVLQTAYAMGRGGGIVNAD